MEEEAGFLQRTKEIREALKQRAMDVERGIMRTASCDLLETKINQNIQSSFKYCKSHPIKHSSLIQIDKLIQQKQLKRKSESVIKSKQLTKFPSIKRKQYFPYFMKPTDIQLPKMKKVKKLKVLFTGIEPKVKKLNAAYTLMSNR